MRPLFPRSTCEEPVHTTFMKLKATLFKAEGYHCKNSAITIPGLQSSYSEKIFGLALIRVRVGYEQGRGGQIITVARFDPIFLINLKNKIRNFTSEESDSNLTLSDFSLILVLTTSPRKNHE